MMPRRWCRFLPLLIACCLAMPASAAYRARLPAAQVAAAAQAIFPLREYSLAARLLLKSPQLQLDAEAQRIVLEVPVVASVPGEARRHGRLIVSTGLAYRPPSGEVFLGLPRLQSLEMEGVSPSQRRVFAASLLDVLTETLPLVRVLQVTEHDLNHSLAKSLLKAWRVEDGALHIEIGFD